MGGDKKGSTKTQNKGKKEEETSTKPQQEEEHVNKQLHPLDALYQNLCLLESAVEAKDEYGIKRVLRKNTYIRRRIELDDFRVMVDMWLPADNEAVARLHSDLDACSKSEMKDVGSDDKSEKKRQEYMKKDRKKLTIPEVETYLHMFVVNALLRRSLVEEAFSSVSLLVERANLESRRTIDIFLSKGFQLKARCAELLGRSASIRGELLAAHRTACLRYDEFGQATLITLLLRSFLEANLVEQAVKFAAKANFPETASNNLSVRYLYYMGYVHAIQLDYSLSFQELTQAIRKAPPNTGLGFRITVHKLASIVQLLMGETPERSWFSQPELEIPLHPYFELVKAVRNGSLAEYDQVRADHSKIFEKDKLASLIVRLRNSVIRTGLRRINLSYSRISFKDIAKRLALDSAESAELACAKAIRDGVIDANVDHEHGFLKSKDVLDIYSTIEPQHAFNKRIQFCLSIHNEAVKSMRYPPDAHKAKHDLTEDKDAKTTEEIAKEIEEELEEDE